MTTVPTGQECKLYINKGTYETPDWLEVQPIKDNSRPDSKKEIEIGDRGSRFMKYRKGRRDMSFDFDLTYKKASPAFVKLRDAYEADDEEGHLDVLVLDGPVEEDTSRGVRAFVEVVKWDTDEPLDDGVKVSTSLKPTYHVEGEGDEATEIEPSVWPVEEEGGGGGGGGGA